jgi:hypothetical protein
MEMKLEFNTMYIKEFFGNWDNSKIIIVLFKFFFLL